MRRKIKIKKELKEKFAALGISDYDIAFGEGYRQGEFDGEQEGQKYYFSHLRDGDILKSKTGEIFIIHRL